MNDHDLIIRIDQRQSQMMETQDEILKQVRATNGRVTELETYRATHTLTTVERVKQIEEHEKRIKTIEDEKLITKGSSKTLKWMIGSGAGTALIVMIIEYFIKHN